MVGPVLRQRAFQSAGASCESRWSRAFQARTGDGDESLASFVTRRLGREVLDRVAQPLAGGIYTADPEALSIGATMPRFVEMERRYGSVIRGLRAAGRCAQRRGASAPVARAGACSRVSGTGWRHWPRRSPRASADRFVQGAEVVAMPRSGDAMAARARGAVDSHRGRRGRSAPRRPMRHRGCCASIAPCGGEAARRDQLRVGGDGQSGVSRERFRASARRVRLRRTDQASIGA